MTFRSSPQGPQPKGPARKRRISNVQRIRQHASADLGVAHLIEDTVRAAPDAIAVQDDAQSKSYQELWADSEQIARQLVARRSAGDVFVAVCLPRGIALLTVMLGAWRARLGFVPLDPEYPDERLMHMVQDSGASLVICGAADLDRFRHLDTKTLSPEQLGVASSAELPPLPGANDLAYMIYTSGSTGRPKGVPIHHGSLLNHNIWFGLELGLARDVRCLHFCSPSFDIAMEEIFPTLGFGATLVVRDEALLDPVDLVSFIKEQNVNILNIPTAYWSNFVRTLERSELSLPECVDTCMIGGEHANPDVVRRWSRVASNVRLLNMYGPTETTITAACYDAAGGLCDGELPIGRPVAGHTAYIVDANLQLVEPSEAGELCLAGPGLSSGYWKRDELSEEKFPVLDFAGSTARIYRTGDRVRMNESGDLMFLGRLDDQVKIRGYRIELGEVERCLLQVPGVDDGAVVFVQSQVGDGPRLHAAYVGRCTESQLRTRLSSTLPSHMIPARIERLTSLPRLPNGKLDRRRLAKAGSRATTSSARQASNLSELTLLDICRHVLGDHQLGMDANFFEAGGHSLHGIEVIERANHAGLPLRPEDFFKDATLRGLAASADTRLQTRDRRSALVELQTRGDLPPAVFFHSMPGDLLGYGALVHHLGKLRPCVGFQAVYASQGAPTRIEKLATRYAAEIKRRYQEGALHLVGWCFGGHIAIEVARILRAKGWHHVSLTMVEGYPVLGRAQHYLNRAQALAKLSPGELLNFARARQRGLHRERLDEHALFALRANQGAFSARNAVHRANDQAYRRYRSRPIDCSMLLIRGRELPGTLLSSDYGWSSYVRDVHTLQVDAEHQSILKEPHVRDVASILKRWFTRNDASPVDS